MLCRVTQYIGHTLWQIQASPTNILYAEVTGRQRLLSPAVILVTMTGRMCVICPVSSNTMTEVEMVCVTEPAMAAAPGRRRERGREGEREGGRERGGEGGRKGGRGGRKEGEEGRKGEEKRGRKRERNGWNGVLVHVAFLPGLPCFVLEFAFSIIHGSERKPKNKNREDLGTRLGGGEGMDGE